MFPGSFADTDPDKPAVIMATSGEVVTYSRRHAVNELGDRVRSPSVVTVVS